MITLEFPWPPAALSPNARPHWATKAKAAKKYKADCYWACKAAYTHHERLDLMSRLGGLKLAVTFHPPDKRRRDSDNLMGSGKYLFDAISEFTQIDDSRFTYTISKSTPIKHGAVKVCIK